MIGRINGLQSRLIVALIQKPASTIAAVVLSSKYGPRNSSRLQLNDMEFAAPRIPASPIQLAFTSLIENARLEGKKLRYVEATVSSPRLWAIVDFVKFMGYEDSQANHAIERFVDFRVS
jgi:hypothetical protein